MPQMATLDGIALHSSIATNTTTKIIQTGSSSIVPTIACDDIRSVSKTTSNRYIIIAISDTIPSTKQQTTTRGRPRKKHHDRRNDSLYDMITLICENKGIPVYEHNPSIKWDEMMNQDNQLRRSQRDILKLVHQLLHKLSNGNIEQSLWSHLLLQSNAQIKNYIYDQFFVQEESQLNKLLVNMSKCVQNTVDHCKYEWAMPVVATISSYNKAKSQGFDIGKYTWNRAWRWFSSTKDVTATIEKGYKVSFFYCIRFCSNKIK